GATGARKKSGSGSSTAVRTTGELWRGGWNGCAVTAISDATTSTRPLSHVTSTTQACSPIVRRTSASTDGSCVPVNTLSTWQLPECGSLDRHCRRQFAERDHRQVRQDRFNESSHADTESGRRDDNSTALLAACARHQVGQVAQQGSQLVRAKRLASLFGLGTRDEELHQRGLQTRA